MPPGKLPRETQKESASENLLNQILGLIGKFVAPTTAFYAILYYFGWVRTNSLYGYFGIDQSLLGFSTTDYFLRSIASTFEPLRWLLTLGLIAIWVNYWILRRIREISEYSQRRRAKTSLLILMVVGLLVTYSAPALYLLGFEVLPLFFPSAWLLGIILVSYSFYLWLKLPPAKDSERRETAQPAEIPSSLKQISQVFLLGLYLFGILWWVAIYADNVGKLEARQIENSLSQRACTYVYSQVPLNLEAEGVISKSESEAGAYRYVYSGLRFLIRSGGKYFLLPTSWSEKTPRVIILPDKDGIRIETSPGRFCSP